MFKINKFTDYAIILLDLLARKKTNLNVLQLSEYSAIPAPSVAKIMKKLAKSNFIEASRGVNGGYRLTKPLESLSIKSVFIALDGPLALTQCLSEEDNHNCVIDSCCCMKQGWANLNKKIETLMEQFTLDQFLPKFPKENDTNTK